MALSTFYRHVFTDSGWHLFSFLRSLVCPSYNPTAASITIYIAAPPGPIPKRPPFFHLTEILFLPVMVCAAFPPPFIRYDALWSYGVVRTHPLLFFPPPPDLSSVPFFPCHVTTFFPTPPFNFVPELDRVSNSNVVDPRTPFPLPSPPSYYFLGLLTLPFSRLFLLQFRGVGSQIFPCQTDVPPIFFLSFSNFFLLLFF